MVYRQRSASLVYPVRPRLAMGSLYCLAGLLLCSVISGCSLYGTGRALINHPLEAIECLPECPWVTDSVTLLHSDTGVSVTCGPYPYALYSSMAEAYRLERRQCVTRYQEQGYLRRVAR